MLVVCSTALATPAALATASNAAASNASASNAAASAAAGNAAWKLAAYAKTNPVCLGDKILFMLRWQPNPNYVNPLSSLSGDVDDETLAPLTGPKQLLAKANIGTFERAVATPGSGAGVEDFTYTAEKTGAETVTFQAFNDNLEVDTSVSKTFEVKSCDYRFTLMVKDDLITTTEHGPLGLYHVMQATGMLQRGDPINLNLYEAFDKEITDTFTVTYTMDCTVSVPEYGHTSGQLDAKAVKNEDGSVNLKLGPPKNFKAVIAYTIICPDSDPQSVNLAVDVSGGKDPWIEADFPLAEGRESIDSFTLNPGLAKMQGAGFQVTSTAWLQLEKVVK